MGLMLQLWHNFGTKSKIERIEMLFHAPEKSNKNWRFWIQEKWKWEQNGVWKWRGVGDEGGGYGLS